MAEQRFQAVLAVISDGLSISQVAERVGVSRQTLHAWLARYEAGGLEGLVDRSHQPALELRRSRPYWGPRRLVFELAKRKVAPVPSESAAHRALVRAGMIDPRLRDRRSRKWKRWERGTPMGLWQMDVVGGFPLADGTSAKPLTGIDDHSRMCVCARLMTRQCTRAGIGARFGGSAGIVKYCRHQAITAPRLPTPSNEIMWYPASRRGVGMAMGVMRANAARGIRRLGLKPRKR